jgi:hypothetical protein
MKSWCDKEQESMLLCGMLRHNTMQRMMNNGRTGDPHISEENGFAISC